MLKKSYTLYLISSNSSNKLLSLYGYVWIYTYTVWFLCSQEFFLRNLCYKLTVYLQYIITSINVIQFKLKH